MTVIAAGFDGGVPKRREEGSALRRDAKPAIPAPAEEARVGAPAPRRTDEADNATAVRPATSPAAPSTPASPRPSTPTQVTFDDDDLDIPDFLK